MTVGDLVRAYMRKHCFDRKHLYSVTKCHPRRPEVAVAGIGSAHGERKAIYIDKSLI